MDTQATNIVRILEIDRDAEAPSPYLPGTNIQYAWDSTSLGLLKTCPRLYQYTMIDGYQPKEESVHLRFGIELHSALQDYDLSRAAGVKHEDAIHDTIRALLERTYGWAPDEDTKAGKYKNRRSIVRTVVDYLDHYKDDPATTVLLQDGRPAVELSFRFELDFGPKSIDKDAHIMVEDRPFLLTGHLDRVVEFSGDQYVMDRKSTMTTPSPYYFSQYQPNNQMTLYTLASQVIMASPVKGVIIDAVQILVDSTSFARGFTLRTPDQLDEWTHDLRYWLSLAEGYAIQGYWPMNDTACDKFGGCRFRDICSKSPQVREQFLRKFNKLEAGERWNPLKVRG